MLLAGWDVVVMLSLMEFGNVGREVQQRGRFIGKRMLAGKEEGFWKYWLAGEDVKMASEKGCGLMGWIKIVFLPT